MEKLPSNPGDSEIISSKRKQNRAGTALCLSGGGYRAAIFHLGVLCRLNELGRLSQVTHFSSVSGGSIILAHIAQTLLPWIEPDGIFLNWEEKAARPFRELMARDLRTVPILKGFLPWNVFRRGYNTKYFDESNQSEPKSSFWLTAQTR